MNPKENKWAGDENKQFEPGVQFAIGLAQNIRRKVMPVYGIKQRDLPVNQISGDFNYAVDKLAEEEIKKEFENLWKKGKSWGYATEDQGLILPPKSPELIFLIDPVDGSRTAEIGAENTTITIAGVKGDYRNAAFSDIQFGVTLAIKENRIFVIQKGKGVFEIINRKPVSIKKRENVPGDLKVCSAVYETYSMSSKYTGIVFDPLKKEIRFHSEFPSGSYSALTVARGQNELHVDIRRRLILDFPNLDVELKPNSKSLSPLDIAAEWLMIKELGGKVTDAYGKDLDDVRLWSFDKDGSWSKDIQISWIGAITPDLHKLAFEKIQEGFENLINKV